MIRRIAMCALGALALLAVPVTGFAQAAADRPLEIKKLDSGKLPTPEYQVKRGNSSARARDWFAIQVTYDTQPEWLEEATFTYYVLARAKNPPQGRSPLTMFKADVTYVNVARGRHKADVYLHPVALARFGDVERVAVLVTVGGRLVAADGFPQGSGQQRWWEQMSPVDGYLMNKAQSPFSLLNYDDYEMIKPTL